MWNTIKDIGRKVGRFLGIIQHLEKIEDHKKIIVNQDEYKRINDNKRLYQGYIKEWHDLRYKNTNGHMVQRKQMTLGMPKIIAEKMASLIFNEGVRITLAEESQKQTEWELIEDVITSAKFISEFQRYLEYMFALGGVVVEVYLDGEQPKIAYATADAVFPTSQDTENIDEIVIANQFTQEGKVYTLLKWHEWVNENHYRITNELYEAHDYQTLGDKVPLARMFPDMERITELEIDRPMFVYMKPNVANNKNITSPLGVSVFENAKDTIRMLDVMYDFWYTEFRLGKRRVAVPEYMVKTGVDMHGNPFTYFDDSEELFVALNSQQMETFEVKDLTTDLRVTDIVNSIQSLLDILSMQVGLSVGTFNFTEQGIKTATQVVSEQSETFRTRSSHLLIIEDSIRDLIVTISNAVKLAYPNIDVLERDDISIDFNDGVFTDRSAELNFWSKAVATSLASKRKAIQRLFNLSDEDTDEEMARIKAELLGMDYDTIQAQAENIQLGGWE